ncbi:MAG: dual specificity protein kinase kns1 [Thelocarpon impressellum]|nr:MAG: dual specificity protein kinase kns1 [Thelocarpon impressellum]
MSTPSTASATNPPPHLHYGYPHRQGFQSGAGTSGGGYHSGNTLLSGTSRLASSSHYGFPGTHPSGAATAGATATTTPGNTSVGTGGARRTAAASVGRQAPHDATMRASQSSSARRESRQRQRTPNWREFYKNGLPKEVIVIDDDDDDEEPPQDGYDSSEREAVPAPYAQPNYVARTVAGHGSTRHADKKRKTATSGGVYDPVYHQQASTADAHTPHFADSPTTTVSTDRTTSALTTTAATSLGSHYSQPADRYDEVEVVGQKRKRTRKAAADEAKKREIETQGDAYSSYCPPPKPPIKAKEVYVAVAHDNSYMKHQKVDDEDGHYIVVPDSELTERYHISRLLGQGTFGKVVEAYDKRKRTRCAIKIIRSVQKYRDASRIELRVLSTLSSNDRQNKNKCIHLRDCFDYRNHICIVTDLLGQSVFDFLKSNQFVPFPNSQIQSFARQLLTSVAFLHDLNLIHTDLKPENILLVENAYQTFTYNRQIPSSSTTISRQARHRKVLLDTEIRLIDFGSATFDDEYHSSVVSTRHYRAPEIILGLGWSYPCDIWSIGCILVEFFTGDALFQTHDNLEHLAMMESICGGKIDAKLIREVQASNKRHSNPAAKYFVRGHRLDYPNAETPKASKKYVKAMKRLHEIIPPSNNFNKMFLDLLRKIFLYDPKARITAKDALKHPWFKESTMDDGSEAARLRLERERERERAALAHGRAHGY